MKAEQVDQALIQKFITEGERLVFWHDPNGEFGDHIAQGLSDELGEVQILRVAEVGGLSAKHRLERQDTAGKYLVYTSGARPPADEDWLLDIRLYSAEFYADITSIWLQDLGLSELYLRDHLKKRAVFLGNQERRKKLKRFTTEARDEQSLDAAMVAVLAGSEVASPFPILRALCHGHVSEGRFELGQDPEIMASMEKMGLSEPFWGWMGREFDYASDTPSLSGLLRQLLISELVYRSNDASLESLAHFVLPETRIGNASVFLTQWRDSSAKSSSYDAVALAVAEELQVKSAISGLALESIQEVVTFWEVEKRILAELKDRILDEADVIDVESVSTIANARRAMHWLDGPGRELPERIAISDAYGALIAAAALFQLQAEHRHKLNFTSPEALLSAYQADLYRFDRLYRQFFVKAHMAQSQGWDLLKDLAARVERVYDQGFLQPLGLEWSRLLDEGFLDTWSLDDLPSQQDFYAEIIRPHLAEAERKRAFVIISDAVRYEAATELVDFLNGQYRMNARLNAMLGVLPSYTALGMASLLPHKVISYSDKGEVLIDGRSVAGTDARDKLLATVEGMACQAKDLRIMKSEEAREFTRNKRVVYIYHNVVDARGDSTSTEGETFDAVSDCISELVALVRICIGKLNAAKVWITADHGFLFQQESPSLTDKSKLSQKPEQAVKENKRYVIGRHLGEIREAHHGSIQATACAEGGMEFWVPRGANRFHLSGGARFVHGGAMPQEVMIPLVTVTQLRGEKGRVSKIRKVSVQVLGSNHKITTPKYRFEVIQTEAVGDRREPLVVRAAVYDRDQPVTSVETVTFDSTSDSIDERKKQIRLELQAGTFDKAKPYRFVLRDVATDAEVQSAPVIIDRSFDDDF